MDNNILAIVIQEGSKLFSQYMRNNKPTTIDQPTEDSLNKFLASQDQRFAAFYPQPEPEPEPKPIKVKAPKQAVQITVEQTQEEESGKASAIATGCVPCAMGHFGTCSGILNESVRFAHGEQGLASPEVADRIGMCLDELNAMERVDLRPEMTVQLTGWEKELADKALAESRATRHALEAIQSADDLEMAAAKIQTARKDIGRQWFQNKLAALSPADKDEISKRVMAKIQEMANTPAEEEPIEA